MDSQNDDLKTIEYLGSPLQLNKNEESKNLQTKNFIIKNWLILFSILITIGIISTLIPKDIEVKQSLDNFLTSIDQFFDIEQPLFINNSFEDSSQENQHQKEIYGRTLPILKPDKEKQDEIVRSFLFAYQAYKKYAWGFDFLLPQTKEGENVFSGGLTITDSLDTMLIMGLNDEFKEAREWVEKKFTMEGEYSVFETVIRHLGSFLSTYQLTGDDLFLEKAKYVADTLMPVFETSTGLFETYFQTTNGETTSYGSDEAILAEIGSIQMEFYTLSMITKDPKYAKAASNIHKTLFENFHEGLLPERISTTTGESKSNVYSFDAMSDSFYEYLIKLYLMTGRRIPLYLDRYLLAIEDARKYLLHEQSQYTFFSHKDERYMTHLVTFAAGMLALGSIQENKNALKDLRLADKLSDTYVKLYKDFSSHLMPESFRISYKNRIRVEDSAYRLRPETIESLYVLYRLTGKQKYRDEAWEIFQAIQKQCKVKTGGYTSVMHTERSRAMQINFQDSYFLAETLKYLYLIFSGSDILPTDQWIFNTEAHPLKVWTEEEFNSIKDAIQLS